MSDFSELANHFRMWAKTIVELGCGDGVSAAKIMKWLAIDATLTCVNWPSPQSGDDPTRFLRPWMSDKRLTLLFGDTRDPKVYSRVPNDIDLLHIDSTHTKECAEQEWKIYEPKLSSKAVVVVDDLDHNDMMDFWRLITHDKYEREDGKVGIIIYKRK